MVDITVLNVPKDFPRDLLDFVLARWSKPLTRPIWFKFCSRLEGALGNYIWARKRHEIRLCKQSLWPRGGHNWVNALYTIKTLIHELRHAYQEESWSCDRMSHSLALSEPLHLGQSRESDYWAEFEVDARIYCEKAMREVLKNFTVVDETLARVPKSSS